MVKKSMNSMLFLILFFVVLININYIFAAESIKITGTINNISSDIYLKINSNAASGVDSYDMIARDLPSGNYSTFYSNVSNDRFSIDSWSTNPRITTLVYSLSSPQTGTLTFSWVALTGSIDANFMDYGDDPTYSTLIQTTNMRLNSAYTTDLNSDSNIYVKVSITDYVAPATTETSGGGGGGGGGAPSKGKAEISIETESIQIPIVINTVKTRPIRISNNGNASGNIAISVEGLTDILSIKDTSFSLGVGESKDVEIKVIGPAKPGIYTGKIIVNGQEILVSVNVNTKELLFDAGIVIPDEFKVINTGDKLASQITLIPMGEQQRMDVTLNYIIKDFEGRTYFSESETILIEEQKTFKKEFSTQNLPAGNYVLGLELIYPNGVATSTSHFTIKGREEAKKTNYYIVLFLLGIGILILVILILWVINSYRKAVKKLKIKRRR